MSDEKKAAKSTKSKEPSYTFPKLLGACADRLYELGERKTKAQRAVDVIDKEERALEQHVIAELEGQDAESVGGRRAKAKLLKVDVPTLKDDKPFYEYVRKHRAFHLLQKRLSSTAIREMWAEGKRVPGVDKFIHKKISITKA